ncbi:alpha/beta hydrolase [Actinomadura sp. B10D3]|uniref:alpha/beta fold hydrolase n=1 Tax=Actinomadura sp. B10D3 TaxID=3153557 RepID=UPI00325E9884
MTPRRAPAGFATLAGDDIIVDGARLAFSMQGEGDPVVFVHGTPSHSYLWRNIAPRVRDAGFQTVVYDLLGFGRSERPLGRDTSVAAQADLLPAMLDVLGIGSATIIAHDIGGAIGQILAVHRPERVRKLMMIDTVTYDSWPSETWRRIIRDNDDLRYVRDEGEFSAMLSRQLRMTVSDPESMNETILRNYLLPHDGVAGRGSFFTHQVRHYDSRYTQEISSQLPSLTMPVRVVWGENDLWQPVSYAERLCRDIPGAQLSIIPEAGHFLPEDAPERLTEQILDFLDNTA